MRKIILIAVLCFSFIANAQINSVSLQASGLTCSMCSNAISKALKSLDFVWKVDPDIKTYSFEISFKPDSKIDFELIRKKVESAGFFVSAFYVSLSLDSIPVSSGVPFVIQDMTFLFVKENYRVPFGNGKVRILDKGYVPLEEYKRNKYQVQSSQVYHVALVANQ
ncbi:heavy-metal-associated domain-containing protein [Flavihumibacter rivuli]|uniref:heavy-metal-associated domain-containing protein n=1 Tax=Flavihumibacter rivuli TaxID=2838156 RepID=UPI001BDF479C|nr:heavy-metal-associated domain-containing protein [Flavihumibacter rivuli]ULQ57786.1 heavy-metal-associated domain-containing protein [Flavihumibacter rivuli]